MRSSGESPEQILRRRAQAIAQAPEETGSRRIFAEVALIRVGRDVIGLPGEHLLEIVSVMSITRLPATPAWLPGIVQVRGELMSAVDLASLYGLRDPIEPAYLAVIGDPRGRLGLLADEILGFQAVLQDELAPQLADLGDSDLPLLGVSRDLIVLLDVPRLLADRRLIVE